MKTKDKGDVIATGQRRLDLCYFIQNKLGLKQLPQVTHQGCFNLD